MYDGLDRTDAAAIQIADSSRVGIAMASINAHYTIGNLQLMAVGNITSISNSDAYNDFTGATLGSQVMGYYGEVAYRIPLRSGEAYPRLIPFVRYENYDTHHSVGERITKNDAYNREILTTGVGFQITPGTILKTDFQWVKTGVNAKPTNILNVGFGYWF
jgi:hypothetical protein